MVLGECISIFDLDLTDPIERQKVVKEIDDFAKKPIEQSQSKNDLLSTRFIDFEKGGGNAANVGNSLAELNLQMKDLDPSAVDFAKSGLLGRFFNPARKYFNRYKKADVVIATIIKSLELGKRSLQNDNVTLANEEKQLILITNILKEDAEKGMARDKVIEEQIQEAEASGDVDIDKINFVKDEILFPLRQRVMDIEQMIVVNQQGIVSLNIIQKSNKELIRGAERAKNVSITALRTGIMIAHASLNQKIVLDKIDAISATTSDIIQKNAEMIKDNSTRVAEQATRPTIDPQVLINAFNDVATAYDEIGKYKRESLSVMQESINTFNELNKEGQKVVDKIADEEAVING